MIDPLGGEGNGNPLQCSCLDNPMDRGAWWAAVYGVAESRTRLKRLSMHACIGEGNGNPLQYSCLENPRDRGARWAAIYGVAQSRTWLKWLSSSSRDPTASRQLRLREEHVKTPWEGCPLQAKERGLKRKQIFQHFALRHPASGTVRKSISTD